MKGELPSFAVVVPAFNEEHGIAACVAAVDAALSRIPNRTAIVIVEDGSSDRTSDRLEELERQYPELVVVRHRANRGYGAALRTGAGVAEQRGYAYVAYMDSDLTNDPRYLVDFAARMDEGADVIKATRYSAGGGTSGVPLQRIVPSVVGNRIARVLYGLPITDPTNGFRAVKAELLLGIELRENGFAVIMEELYRLRAVARSYAEVPIILTSRGDHLRGTAFDYGPKALWSYLRYPLLAARDRLQGHF
jgi:dolichol-phosphate mannosyltransferase